MALSALTTQVSVVHLNLQYIIGNEIGSWLTDMLRVVCPHWKMPLDDPHSLPKLEHISFGGPAPHDEEIGEFLSVHPRLEQERHHNGKLKVKITDASRTLPRDVAVVHGAMGTSSECLDIPTDLASAGIDAEIMGSAPKIVCGTALGFVFDKSQYRANQCALDDFENKDIWRDVYIFGPRY